MEQIPGAQFRGKHPVSAQNKSLISDTVYVKIGVLLLLDCPKRQKL